MHGLVRAESSAERAAREAAETRQAQADEPKPGPNFRAKPGTPRRP
jgi:hypothetical protein